MKSTTVPWVRVLRRVLLGGLALGLVGLLALAVVYGLLAPRLPDVQALRQVELQLPLSVYTRDGKLIALFGETRRYPVAIAEVPEHVKQAVLATEDARFYEHPGIDWRGIVRAVWLLATTRDRRVPGGSTITQQVARQFFLSSEYSYTRKLTEIFLALKMERELSKDEILELYLNKSFFGNRAYGIAAAAEFYFGKPLANLSVAEAATLAAIPKFPSSGNPLVNPGRALERRNYAIGRMREEGFIDAATARAALAEPLQAQAHEPPVEVEAPYVAEMVRQAMLERYGEQALNHGYRVTTTLIAAEQEAARAGITQALLDYDRRHGWRGPEAHWEAADGDPAALLERLKRVPTVAGMPPALVRSVTAKAAEVLLASGERVRLELGEVRWAAAYIDENRRRGAPSAVGQVLAVNDLIRLRPHPDGRGYDLAQVPKVQGALVALDPEDGALRALVGGLSFGLNKFNRATQAQRNPGSSFKPFIYAAAFERGFNPASIVLDAPVVFKDQQTGETWQPQNDNESFAGPMRLREAMVTSRNLVSVRLLDAIGVGYARRYLQSFGFPAERLPQNLTLALGTSALSPLQMAAGYAVFANGGYRVEPWFIASVADRNGTVIAAEHPARACRRCAALAPADSARGGGFDLDPGAAAPAQSGEEAGPPAFAPAPRAIDERTVFLVDSLLKDVVRRGTGHGAMVLGRRDLGGKTGTTNEFRDAWFSGYGPGAVASAWIGMDDFSSLGRGEFAARAALPAWIAYMRQALDGAPETRTRTPEGVVAVRIDPVTGWLAEAGSAGSIVEYLKLEDIARMEDQRARRQTDISEQEAFDIF